MRIKLSVLALLVAALIATLSLGASGLEMAGQASAPAAAQQSDLETSIASWIKELSAQPEFREWKDASWTKDPLGPGQRGYIVHVKQGELLLGYLVVGITESGGYQLLEYGTGEHPLYSMKSLHEALVRYGLSPERTTSEKWYQNALHAYWLIKHESGILVIDAKVGFELPVPTEGLKPLTIEAVGAAGASLVKASELRAPWNPMDRIGWLTETAQPLALTVPMVYEAQLIPGRMSFPFAVLGEHRWSDSTAFIALDHLGTRYIPADLLERHGSYYPYR